MDVMQKLLLVSGCPRSGTTLLNLLLNTHPNIAISNECNLIAVVHALREGVFFREKKLLSEGQPLLIREQSPRENWQMSDLYDLVPRFDSQVVPILRSFITGIKPGLDPATISIIGDKLPKYYSSDLSSLISLKEIDFHLIHITRNPLDVCSSFLRRQKNALAGKDYWKSTLTPDGVAQEWIKAWHFRSSSFVKSNKVKFLDVNYDQLIASPSKFLKQLSSFLGVENLFSADMVRDTPVPQLITVSELVSLAPELKAVLEAWPTLPLFLSPVNGPKKNKPTPVVQNSTYSSRTNPTMVQGRNFQKMPLAQNQPGEERPIRLQSSELLQKACKFVSNECIEGDYYEFGVFRGEFFFSAVQTILSTLQHRLQASNQLGANKEADEIRGRMLKQMQFHAFDSFEGLPALSTEDFYSKDFTEGQFSFTENKFLSVGQSFAMPMHRIHTYPGWFSQTCAPEAAEG